MVRLLIGSVLGGLAQMIVGFLFWGTPLGRIAYAVAGEAQNADVQAALARNLTASGAGTYMIPWPDSPGGTVLLGKGPVALVMFSPAGYAPMDPSALIGGLVLSVVTILLVALALSGIATRVTDFSGRMKLVVAFGVATALYFIIGQPVYNFYMPWTYWVYLFVSCVAGFVAGGFVLVRWFMPTTPAAMRDGM